MMETWKKWDPINDVSTKFYKESLFDSKGEVILVLQEEISGRKLIVTFDRRILSYRNTDEGSLLEMLYYLEQNYGRDFYSKRSLFEIENSEYIKWFLKESSGIYTKEEVKHYVFLTSDDVIEILSTCAPTVKIIESR
jgi:hypothetical protein